MTVSMLVVHRGADRWRELDLCVAKVLLPTLRPGDIVVLDNLGSHRSKAVRQIIRSDGAKLFFLPTNTHPTWNPIEQVFAKLKHLLSERLPLEPVETLCAPQSAMPSQPLPQKNAQTISKIQAIAPNFITL